MSDAPPPPDSLGAARPPRGTLALLGLVIIALAGVAAWLVAIPLPVVIGGGVVSALVLLVWLARQRKRERVAPLESQSGKHG